MLMIMMNWWRKCSKLIYKLEILISLLFACEIDVFSLFFSTLSLHFFAFQLSFHCYCRKCKCKCFVFKTETRIIKIDAAQFEFHYSVFVLYSYASVSLCFYTISSSVNGKFRSIVVELSFFFLHRNKSLHHKLKCQLV